jgi:hypothetical protein
MTLPNGQFVWYEHLTHDAEAASAFYQHVVGWSAAAADIPDAPPYTILSAGERPVAGLMTFPEGCGTGSDPGWVGYVSVDDVDAFVAKVEALGGTLHVGPMEIAEVGRFAVVADPQGAVFALYTSACEGPPPPAMGTPGLAGWHELWAKDGAAAFAFYAELFGWTKTEAFDMGPSGVYQLFATATEAVGGMMTAEAGVSTGWLFYFNVPELDAAMARVLDKGGKVAFGPQEVPGGMWIIQCHDPQGGEFALVAPVR